ncbi:MAG: SEC-C metal-binding domain-containing protein [Candidatus Methylumidiphilus sp.]
MVHGDKELLEKLGRNDPCPCGSGRLFQKMLPVFGLLLRGLTGMSIRVS